MINNKLHITKTSKKCRKTYRVMNKNAYTSIHFPRANARLTNRQRGKIHPFNPPKSVDFFMLSACAQAPYVLYKSLSPLVKLSCKQLVKKSHLNLHTQLDGI